MNDIILYAAALEIGVYEMKAFAYLYATSFPNSYWGKANPRLRRKILATLALPTPLDLIAMKFQERKHHSLEAKVGA